MTITDRAKMFMRQATGTERIYYLFATETCCGAGVGAMLKKRRDDVTYIEIEGIPFQFEQAMLLSLHGMIIDVEQDAGKETLIIHTTN